MMKFFQKGDKPTFIIKLLAFVWILICNAVVQILINTIAPGLHAWSWTIFLANVLFFIKDNHNQKEGLLENACGGIFGLLGAYGLVMVQVALVGSGMSTLMATMIPIAVFLFISIALNSFVPYVFNNIALCFFLVALINELTIGGFVSQFGLHILGVIIGNAIVNVGIIVIIKVMIKHFTKKAMAAAVASKPAEAKENPAE